LNYNCEIEHPVALQLGGSSPESLAAAVKIALRYNYDAINLNCGCPSDKVSGKGCFGAALMREPELTQELCKNMFEAARSGASPSSSSTITPSPPPVTVKCRIGVDDNDSYEDLRHFVETLEKAGITHFIIHARKAILNMKLTPKQNRDIPPLRYEIVHKLARDLPHLTFVLNGGVKSYEETEECLNSGSGVVGVMVGREILNRPWYWGDVDRRLYGAENPGISRREILGNYSNYATHEMAAHPKLGLGTILKPIQNLFIGERGARMYRRVLAEMSAKKFPVQDIIRNATACIGDEDLDKRW